MGVEACIASLDPRFCWALLLPPRTLDLLLVFWLCFEPIEDMDSILFAELCKIDETKDAIFVYLFWWIKKKREEEKEKESKGHFFCKFIKYNENQIEIQSFACDNCFLAFN